MKPETENTPHSPAAFTLGGMLRKVWRAITLKNLREEWRLEVESRVESELRTLRWCVEQDAQSRENQRIEFDARLALLRAKTRHHRLCSRILERCASRHHVPPCMIAASRRCAPCPVVEALKTEVQPPAQSAQAAPTRQSTPQCGAAYKPAQNRPEQPL